LGFFSGAPFFCPKLVGEPRGGLGLGVKTKTRGLNFPHLFFPPFQQKTPGFPVCVFVFFSRGLVGFLDVVFGFSPWGTLGGFTFFFPGDWFVGCLCHFFLFWFFFSPPVVFSGSPPGGFFETPKKKTCGPYQGHLFSPCFEVHPDWGFFFFFCSPPPPRGVFFCFWGFGCWFVFPFFPLVFLDRENLKFFGFLALARGGPGPVGLPGLGETLGALGRVCKIGTNPPEQTQGLPTNPRVWSSVVPKLFFLLFFFFFWWVWAPPTNPTKRVGPPFFVFFLGGWFCAPPCFWIAVSLTSWVFFWWVWGGVEPPVFCFVFLSLTR